MAKFSLKPGWKLPFFSTKETFVNITGFRHNSYLHAPASWACVAFCSGNYLFPYLQVKCKTASGAWAFTLLTSALRLLF